jgi:hypothetical protein
MKLSLTDWIYLYEGRLHAPPFVGRCFLYEIHDHKSSLLVYHKPPVSSDGYSYSNTDLTKFSATESTIDEIFVHFAPSDSLPLSELAEISPVRIKLSKDAIARQPLGDLFIEIQQWQLPFKRGFAIDRSNGSHHEYQIENTLFQIQSPVPVIDLGKYAINVDACFRSWKISIISIADKKAYDVNCQKDWSMTALRVKNGWHPTLTWQLARSHRK